MNDTITPPKIHNGIFTITNPESGERRTFKIRTQGDDSKFAPGKRVLYLLTGPDNTNFRDWTGFAFVTDQGIHVWKSRLNAAATCAKEWTQWQRLAALVWQLIAEQEEWLVDRYEVDFARNCLRCNRLLTTPESIHSGIGPICQSL